VLNAWLIGLGRITYQLEGDKLRLKPCSHIGGVLYANKYVSKRNQIKFSQFIDCNDKAISDFKKFIGSNPLFSEVCFNDFTFNNKILDNNENPDIAIIATSTQSHFDLLTHLIKRQVKKIVIEKPVVQTSSQAKKINKLLKNSSSQLFINYERRRHINYKNLKRQIEEKKWGEVLSYNALFASNQDSLFINELYEGALLHDTTHMLDIVMFLFGEVTKNNFISKKNCHTLLLTHSEISGEIKTIINASYFQFDLRIFFTNAVIEIGNGYFNVRKTVKSKKYSSFHELGNSNSLTKTYSIKENPFTQLYLEVIHSEKGSLHIFEALQNIKILLT